MKNYTIVGAGKSGLAAALLAQKKGFGVFVTETKTSEQLGNTAYILEDHQISFESGGHSERALSCDRIIVSPGVPPNNTFIQEANRRGIPIISELEFAWSFLEPQRNPVIAITGTNGKTTTTALTAHVLNCSGRKAIACGNIGTPLSALIDTLEPETILVVETSSYQLDKTQTFCPDVAVILNITPDHLSYHGSYEEYCQAKWKIFMNQTEKNVVILCADNPDAARAAQNGLYPMKAHLQFFSVRAPQQGAYTNDGWIVLRRPAGGNQYKEERIMRIDELRIPGVHNVYNSMAAALSARAFEVRNENIRDSLMSFTGVEHRLEFVRVLNDVEYINDSKATNVNSTWYALSSYQKPLLWIAGGRGDNNDYAQLDELVRERVQGIICVGEEADTIFHHFSGFTRCVRVTSFDEAVLTAQGLANPGDVVLFSPACKSFDMFINYEHRGEVFKELVGQLS